jgi:hypothetical protein
MKDNGMDRKRRMIISRNNVLKFFDLLSEPKILLANYLQRLKLPYAEGI